MARRTGSKQRIFDQCMLGGPARKRTCMSTDMADFDCDELVFCDGSHVHGASSGKDARGRYVSARLATYPSRLCFLIARAVLATLTFFLSSGEGPTGWQRADLKIRRITQWSRLSSDASEKATAFLNETSVQGKGTVLTEAQQALYMHVDDKATIATGTTVSKARESSTALMEQSAEALVKAGFRVTDRRAATDKQKIVGYELEESPARLRAPAVKSLQVRESLLWLAEQNWVVVDTLRALVGVWLWLALLRRDLLCLPQSVFRLIQVHAGSTVVWWPSARREVFAMARVVLAFYADVGAPTPSVIMATDAMGADDTSAGDCGGFGVVAGDVPHELALDCLRSGARPGKALQRDLQLKGRVSPDKPLTRTTPFTRLPPQLFDERTEWVVLCQGRWLFPEHITRGELRAVLRLLRILASCARCHR